MVDKETKVPNLTKSINIMNKEAEIKARFI